MGDIQSCFNSSKSPSKAKVPAPKNTPQSHPTSIKQYHLIRKQQKSIKSGFGNVYLMMSYGKFYAVKQIPYSKLFSISNLKSPSQVVAGQAYKNSKQQFLDQCRLEVQILIKLQSDHVVKLHQFFVDQAVQNFYIVMEKCEVDLRDGLYDDDLIEYKQNKRKLIQQILQAVKFVHSKGITHRDLKPDNILIKKMGKQFKVKICDFGLSKQLLFSLSSKNGTQIYMAPQQFRETKYDYKVDSWALGITFLEIYGLSIPKIQQIKQQIIKNNQFSFQSITELKNDPLIKNIIQGLLKLDCSQRLSVSQALSILKRQSICPQQIAQQPNQKAPLDKKYYKCPQSQKNPSIPNTPHIKQYQIIFCQIVKVLQNLSICHILAKSRSNNSSNKRQYFLIQKIQMKGDSLANAQVELLDWKRERKFIREVQDDASLTKQQREKKERFHFQQNFNKGWYHVINQWLEGHQNRVKQFVRNQKIQVFNQAGKPIKRIVIQSFSDFDGINYYVVYAFDQGLFAKMLPGKKIPTQ